MGRGCAPRALARSAPAAAHARAHAASPSPVPRARTHDRVGLHARSDPRRVSRHARRTRPRSAGRGPSSIEQQVPGQLTSLQLLPLLSTLPPVTLAPPYNVTNSPTEFHMDTGYPCTMAQNFTSPASSAANADRVTWTHTEAQLHRRTHHTPFVVGTQTGPSSYTGGIHKHSDKVTPSPSRQSKKVSDIKTHDSHAVIWSSQKIRVK